MSLDDALKASQIAFYSIGVVVGTSTYPNGEERAAQSGEYRISEEGHRAASVELDTSCGFDSATAEGAATSTPSVTRGEVSGPGHRPRTNDWVATAPAPWAHHAPVLRKQWNRRWELGWKPKPRWSAPPTQAAVQPASFFHGGRQG